MMRALTKRDFTSSLVQVGLRSGDVVLVQCDLLRIGPLAGISDREGILDFYYRGLREVLTEQGTLVVVTAFEDYARYNTPFVLDESPSRTGVFSEYIRCMPQALRSCHPIMSLTALGPMAEEICGGPHIDGLGYDSPWGRLHRKNAKLLTLGYGFQKDGMTFLHYVENLLSVPYQYNKIYNAPVFAYGKEMPGPFTMSVRYLDYGISNNQERFKRHLVEVGAAARMPLGRGFLYFTSCAKVVDKAMECNRQDRYFLLEEPPRFRPDEIPMDGPTGEMKAVYDKGTDLAD